jgi:hypothetical protein
MTRVHLPVSTLLAGILSVGGCSSSSPGSAGGGGTTGVVDATGGTVSSGTGGVVATGGAAQPGTGGTTGVTVPTGGSDATGGMKTTGGAPATGGVKATGGVNATGGNAVGVGGLGTGGKTTGSPGGSSATATGGMTTAGGALTGGRTGNGGNSTTGGSVAVNTNGGRSGTGGTAAGGAATGGTPSTGPCSATASKAASVTVTGSGPHKVVVESNSGISCGTIFRPADLGGAEKYPIFVWGEGACTRSGTSNTASMGEIASYGYFVIADGPPSSGGSCASIGMSTDVVSMGKPLVEYITWAIAENGKSCSAYYNSLDTTKIASDGFSCGGLMSYGTAADPRMTAVGITSSGMTSAVATFYKSIHTPVKILLGGTGDIAYTNGTRDYTQISALGIPTLMLSKDGAGHGGDLGNGKGDFNTVNLAWLNWQLKGDTGATGKGLLVGASCKYCNASGWEFKSANIP